MAKNKAPKVKQVVTYDTGDDYFEMVFDGVAPCLAVRHADGSIEIVASAVAYIGGEKFLIEPLPAVEGSPIATKAVLLPSAIAPYGDKDSLAGEIRAFIHRYLEVEPWAEALLPYYVLLTWVYDLFGSLAYLRFHGDYDSGKSRASKVVGVLCYRPIFLSGAVGPAPIFRMIDRYGGTLVLDEADDMHPDLAKVLLSGYHKGTPVIRCGGDDYEPKGYDVFGPKLIATRKRFKDVALESRCLTVQMRPRTRTDIASSLPSEFWKEAEATRNKCLAYRFHRIRRSPTIPQSANGLQPRLAEICGPLSAVIGDNPSLVSDLERWAAEIHGQLQQDGAISVEGQVIQAAWHCVQAGTPLGMENIAKLASEMLGFPISSQRVGKIVRSLGLDIATPKGRVSLRQEDSNMQKLKRLTDRYDAK